MIDASYLTIGLIGYGLACLAFLALTVVLAIGWRGGVQGTALLTASVVSMLWAAVMALGASTAITLWPALILLSDLLRDFAWLGFLWLVLWMGYTTAGTSHLGLLRLAGIVLLTVLLAQVGLLLVMPLSEIIQWVLAGKVMLTIGALVLIEHLYRSTTADQRWAVKYLCLATGALFVYDFILFSDALLFLGISQTLWDARGYVNALVIPLIAVSAARNPQWSLDVYVSRGVVLHGSALVMAGGYLLLMAAAGFYLRRFGGEWGAVLQAVFLFAAVLLLVALLVSGQLRATLKVYLSKHFFNYRYDYREEWLRFIHTLAASDAPLPERVIRAVGGIVESPGGQLWLSDGGRQYLADARLNWPDRESPVLPHDSQLVAYLRDSQWVIDLDEYRENPERYMGLVLPDWVQQESRLWIIVPLMHEENLLGFLFMAHSRAGHSINWEDRDLLKTAGRQAASHLAQMQTLQALAEARQFEAFNRLSAYVIHDLKNLVAQLSLVVSNARRHSDNPAFLKDAIGTVENAVNRMNRLMLQLRNGTRVAGAQPLDLAALADEAVRNAADRTPAPRFTPPDEAVWVLAERDRLLSVLNHLIQNAQEATPVTGEVSLSTWCDREQACLEVTDTGKGMDRVFVRERLFRPFDSTKGLTGMGIGVYESREFLRALGGELEVRSEPGHGSTFRLLLPRHDPEAHALEDSQEETV